MFLIGIYRNPLDECLLKKIVFLKTFKQIPISLEIRQACRLFYKGYTCIYHNISSVLLKVRKGSRKPNENARSTFFVYFFWNRYNIWNNLKDAAEIYKTQMKLWYSACVCLVHNKVHKHKLRIFNNYYFTTTTTVHESTRYLSHAFMLSHLVYLIDIWTKTTLPSAHVNRWFSPLRTTTCS